MMIRSFLCSLTALLLLSLLAHAARAQQLYRGAYIDRFHLLLSNEKEQEAFFRWVKDNRIEHFSCYDLYTVLSDTVLYRKLGDFMARASSQYGVLSFDAVASSADFLLNKVHPFNVAHRDRHIVFSGFHIEREWWTKAVTFYSHIRNLKRVRNFIRDSAEYKDTRTETYIGWLGKSPAGANTEAGELVKYADVISVSAYKKVPDFNYLHGRLETLAKAAHKAGKVQDVVKTKEGLGFVENEPFPKSHK